MEAIRNILETAINKFNENDLYLIENDLSERCICGRLACYIQQALMTSQFSEYTVDVEYNRGAKGKDKSPKFFHDKLIVVDLIVHKRGHTEYGFDNLFCVEMKKSNSRYGYNSDKARLKDMTNYDYGYNYKCGYMVIVDMKNKALMIESEYRLDNVY